jgi:hypothetical protein
VRHAARRAGDYSVRFSLGGIDRVTSRRDQQLTEAAKVPNGSKADMPLMAALGGKLPLTAIERRANIRQ